MQSIIAIQQSTSIFLAIFVVAILFSIKTKSSDKLFPPDTTEELKGFAILAVVFSHLEYYFSNNSSFLFPLGILAGVGLNIFLFLSGYGLTISNISKPLKTLDFYKHRFIKILVPFWLTLTIILLADAILLRVHYPTAEIVRAYLGLFLSANIYKDINSPLWYITFLFFFYLLYPLFFNKKHPWITSVILFLISLLIIRINPKILENVIHLYKTHTVAFPLGIIAAWLQSKLKLERKLNLKGIYYTPLLILLALLISYTSIHSLVGQGAIKEQTVSIITTVLLLAFFIIKKFEFGLLKKMGQYNYEIYLLHLPIIFRYDFLYNHLPGWLATILYLILLIVIGKILRSVTNSILSNKITLH